MDYLKQADDRRLLTKIDTYVSTEDGLTEQIFRMRIYQGLSFVEIGTALDIPEATAKQDIIAFVKNSERSLGMSIKIPTNQEKEASLQFMLAKGIPPQKRLPMMIPDLIGKIGLKNLFWGTQDCMFLALISRITLGIIFLLPTAAYMEIQLLGLFCISLSLWLIIIC